MTEPNLPAATGSNRIATLRILDANANRAAEGLRAVEEYARFVREDGHLTRLYKELRHELAAVLKRIPAEWLHASRETEADVGTALSTPGEVTRQQTLDVAQSNCKRVEQALRCLEEYAKLIDPQVAASIKPIRYRAYTLARAIQVSAVSEQRLAAARLYVLLDGRANEQEFDSLATSLIDAGVHILQLRDKSLSDRLLLSRARRLRQLTAGHEVQFIVNDRADVAALANADGVHVGQDEVSVKDARAVVGPEAIIGVSTHSIGQARQAVLDGADYIGCGPTFSSGTKSFDHFPGLPYLARVAAEIRLPAFAIGGISENNLADVVRSGFQRVAVGASVLQAADPASAARRLLARLLLGSEPADQATAGSDSGRVP